MGLGQGHGHVDVSAPGIEGALKDGRVETRIAGIHHRVGGETHRRLRNGVRVRGIEPDRLKAIVVHPIGHVAGAALFDVAEDHEVHEVAAASDGSYCFPDSSGACDQHPHVRIIETTGMWSAAPSLVLG
jgi:hypothetical protein